MIPSFVGAKGVGRAQATSPKLGGARALGCRLLPARPVGSSPGHMLPSLQVAEVHLHLLLDK